MRILNIPLIPEKMDSADRSPSPEFSPLAIGEDLTPLPAYKAAQTSSFDIFGLLSNPLKLHEDLASGCGGQTWPAGMVLAKHMLRYHRGALKDARILELGAGGGLVGLAVALGCGLQKKPLYLTDQDEMFELMGRNTKLNNLEGTVKPMILNWGESLSQEIVEFKPNVILAADCVYFEPAFPLLLQTLSDLLALEPDATIFFCFKKRRRADMQFLKKAQKAFQVTEVVDEDRSIFSREGLFLYTFASKTPTANKARQP
ncbi:Protein-lysine N-methyltransferase EFM6 [Colletotrichum orbiculare MAFF 240422]|uniref:Protein-lysine N-methyltransferase EFM6 n=1 Tax=Colletotrichum orbiculare (strain 104-T / ATCC 96160 / CBS 514.97 / LARS 414 / MAFF 240422) TaxID=1213857 RepID=N4VLN2_COLOR|nr:Protein-lysine N-methyltransferase EFM6 [Colletotrichum orbiculare MAFF 240422]